ncbi:MAG: hypothetical protein JWQ40_2217 [Segetibacter sp.]|jgi:glycosyltransferase involved in cell wall biosynthesis|nr:hypothetical protein [Segetibacter sp.]
MKVRKVFISHSWTDVGVNIQTKAVAKKLSENYEVIFLSQARIGAPVIQENKNLRVIEWPHKRPNTLKDFFFACKQIIKEKPDAFIVHFGATNVSMLASWLLRVNYRICWMHTLSGQFYSDKDDEKVARRNVDKRRWVYSLATNVIVLNEYGRRDAKEGYKIPEKKIFKIYNGIYPIPMATHRQEGVKSIRFIGRLDKSKGLDVVLEAFARLSTGREDVRLDIAGAGPELELLTTWIIEHKLEDKITYHGYFTDYEQSRKFISEAYCLIVPSRIDNFPTVILEALSAAVPVIGSDVAGIPDMIENNKDGYLVEVGNIPAFANAILSLVDNEGLRNELGKQAKENFETKFSMDQHVKNVEGFMMGLFKD